MNIKKPLYKAYQMEEFLDIIFFHPLGLAIAKIARKLRLMPNQITYVSMFVGIVGGLMLASIKTAYIGFGFLVLSSVLDSADGQLARMMGNGTLKGRILDGLIGYFMFTSSYLGLTILYISVPDNLGLKFMVPIVLAGGINSALQSSLYDFYRTCFSQIVNGNNIPDFKLEKNIKGFLKFTYNGYFTYQKNLAKNHLNLMEKLKEKFPNGKLDDKTVQIYKKSNTKIIHGWNILGDNTRLLLILSAIIFYKPHWYFFFILGPLNAVMFFLILRQRVVDKKFSESLRENIK